jgi:hypothetical protein
MGQDGYPLDARHPAGDPEPAGTIVADELIGRGTVAGGRRGGHTARFRRGGRSWRSDLDPRQRGSYGRSQDTGRRRASPRRARQDPDERRRCDRERKRAARRRSRRADQQL